MKKPANCNINCFTMRPLGDEYITKTEIVSTSIWDVSHIWLLLYILGKKPGPSSPMLGDLQEQALPTLMQ